MKLKITDLVFCIIFLSCSSNSVDNTQKANKVEVSKTHNKHSAGQTYYFDTTSYVNGCEKAYLQKISRDYQYELLIELKFDSIPKFQEVIFDSSTTTIAISLNKYSEDNTFINNVCNDLQRLIKDQKPPTKFIATNGKLTITNTEKQQYPSKTSILVKDLILVDSSGHKLFLPKEVFKDIMIGWYAG